MSIYSKVTEQDLNNLRKLVEQQKDQRALEIKNGILKQTHDIKLAESFSPLTKKSDKVIETTKQLDELVKKLDVEDESTQTPVLENLTGTQSLRDTLLFMMRSKFFFQISRKG